MNVLSRPGELLSQHLLEVKNIALKRAKSILPHITELLRDAGFSPEEFLRIIELSSYNHDIFKATSHFQNYIRGENRHKVPHALPSAIYTLNHLSNNLSPKAKFVTFTAIAYHHASPSWELPTDITAEIEVQKNFYSDFAKDRILQDFLSDLNYPPPDPANDLRETTKFLFLIDSMLESPQFTKDISLSLFLTAKLVHSLIVDADRLSVSNLPEEAKPDWGKLLQTLKNHVENLKKNSPETIINTQRYRLFLESIKATQETSHCLLQIQPTGSGKTLANLGAALSIADKNRKERILYTLPFISILDQIEEITKRIFPPDLIGVNHHLFTPDEEETKAHLALEMNRLWMFPITITTNVQTFETLIKFNPSTNRRFHRLVNSVVIIDETQGLPSEVDFGKEKKVPFWMFLEHYIPHISKYLKITFILSSATNFLFSTPQKTAENVQAFKLSRVGFHVKIPPRRKYLLNTGEAKSIEELTEEVIEMFQEKGSTLVVVNTINSSKLTKQKLSDIVPTAKIFYLSSHIYPLKRKSVIKSIQEAQKRGEKIILVSTQVVEAGVDLSFSAAFRDIAPIDSLVQVGGRVNRHGEQEQIGIVKIIKLSREDGKIFARWVYDTISIEITDKLLNNLNGEANETVMENLLQAYYDRLRHYKSPIYAVKQIKNLAQLKINNTFVQLIKWQSTLPIFIEIDEKAQEIWCRYSELHDKVFKKNQRELWNELKLISTKLYEYTVPLREKETTKLLEKGAIQEKGFVKLPKEIVNEVYDPEFGFILEESTEDFIW